eukprot:GFUD01016826.1.p1 GENE.GFUD01016826.1~~GFUD01016826.1.p1  ORF type:complete len:503 (+),score=103.28 GFUD01016826.1:2-1510(+)
MGRPAACDKTLICKSVLLLNAIFLIGNGVFCMFFFPYIFNAVLEEKLTIQEGSPAYDAWKKPIIPTKIKIFFFSVKNPTEVENGNKPHLEQVGPFTYREESERVEEVFHENGTVSYKTRKFWYFLEKESLGLETIICSVDIPALAAAEFARGSFLNENSMYWIMKTRSSLFTNKTAKDLLFDGYSDSLLTMGSFFVKEGGVPKDKFGWFYKRNGTTWSDGVVNMATGKTDFQDVGTIKFWHGSNRTIYPDECGDIRGSSAGFTHPDLNRQYIDFFSTDICRPIRFEKEEEVEIEGIKGRRYSLDPQKTFGNENTNPENHCYHAYFKPGMHNSTGCKGGDTTLKTFVSLPHFLGADQFYQDQFEDGSLHPDPIKHSASMTIQPETSIPIQVLMRLQIILQIRSNPNIGAFFSNLPDIFLPVFWFDAEAVVTPELASQVKMITMIPEIAEVVGITSFLVGLCFLGIFVFLKLRENLRLKEESLQMKHREKVPMDVDMKQLDMVT